MSNDFSHNYSYNDIVTAINTIITKLKASFPNAYFHIFFNNRFKYGSTTYYDQTNQINLANNIASHINISRVTCYPESVKWIALRSMDTDEVHPKEEVQHYICDYINESIRGLTVDYSATG